MCGIGVAISEGVAAKDLVDAVNRRGPDSSAVHTVTIRDGVPQLRFFGAVLHIQGELACQQPYVDADGNVLLYNGEIFAVEPNRFFVDTRDGESDTSVVSKLLEVFYNSTEELMLALSCIQGPYSFIFYHATSQSIKFCRDPFGRRSLLVRRSLIDESIEGICSVGALDESHRWEEVSIDGVHTISLRDNKWMSSMSPWPSSRLRLLRTPQSESATKFSESLSSEFLGILRGSVERRANRIMNKSINGTSSVGVLFSGGLDSVVLAALLHLSITDPKDSIDLINVTFVDNESSPDRISAQAALVELRSLYPARTWRLICVNVEEHERNELECHILRLIHPRNTVMDLNIGSAFWFAARGKGFVYDEERNIYVSHQTSCKALLVGIGADEQMGGYGRHRSVFRKGGMAALDEELSKDLERLWMRNLGRDDRCISDSGREPWFPYLDEQVVGFLQKRHLNEIVDLNGEQGIGDKKILREAARLLGLKSSNIKRAVQFGSGIAKQTNKFMAKSNRMGKGDSLIKQPIV